MRAISISIFFTLGLIIFPLLQARESVRVQNHEKAVAELSKLHFFKDGLGMALAPDFIKMFEWFSKVSGSSGNDDDKKSVKKDDNKSGMLAFSSRWGVVDHDKEIKGFYSVPYKDMQVGVLGCIVCHSGKAAGEYHIGIGNKNIDVGQIASDAYRAQKMWIKMTALKRKSPEYKKLEAGALDFAKRLSNNKYNNLSQGMVPVSMIRQWFYRQAGQNLPENSPRSAVKVPHFWGYGEKRFIGQFSDGFGDGNFAGWGLAVELAGTQTVENVRSNLPKIEHAEVILADILPPKYPFSYDQKRAASGKALFDNTCAKCHGTYERDVNGLPIFKAPKHIAIDKIGTDRDRLNGNDDTFKHLIDINPVSEAIKRTFLEPGYFAPRLESVWARFPYMHNASVPSIEALLTRPELRPKFWNLENAGERDRFDEKSLGLTLPTASERKSMEADAKSGKRSIYFTERIGHSNQGHWFGFNETFTTEDKSNLIEYLKSI